jgi:hypothetical protein
MKPGHVRSLFLFAAWCGSTLAFAAEPEDAAKIEFFEKKIRPLLTDKCYNCHSANTNAKGGLRVDDRRGLIDGGNRGAAIVPGSPDESVLIEAIRYQDKGFQMPPEKQLEPEQIADLEQWVKEVQPGLRSTCLSRSASPTQSMTNSARTTGRGSRSMQLIRPKSKTPLGRAATLIASCSPNWKNADSKWLAMPTKPV